MKPLYNTQLSCNTLATLDILNISETSHRRTKYSELFSSFLHRASCETSQGRKLPSTLADTRPAQAIVKHWV